MVVKRAFLTGSNGFHHVCLTTIITRTNWKEHTGGSVSKELIYSAEERVKIGKRNRFGEVKCVGLGFLHRLFLRRC